MSVKVPDFIADPIVRGLSGLYRSVIRGPRTGPTRRFEEFLRSSTGKAPITEMYIARKPILSGVRALMNILSFGGFERARQRLGYDQVMHNALMIKTADGKWTKIEKNHVVESFPMEGPDPKMKAYPIPLPTDRVLTPHDLIQKASGREDRFWQYDPGSDNCQKFTEEVIKDNGLFAGITDPATREVVDPQDAKALVDSLGVAKGVPLQTTNLASRLDRLYYGDGIVPPFMIARVNPRGAPRIRTRRTGAGVRIPSNLTVDQLFAIVNR